MQGEELGPPSPSRDVEPQSAEKEDEASALLARLDLQCSPVVMWPKVLIIPLEDASKWRWVELHIQSVVNFVTVFKVKTTTRKEFMVQPAKGFIPPMSTLIVRIGLQPGAAATKGKFQVVAVPIVSGPIPANVDAFWALLGAAPNFSKKVVKWVIAAPIFTPTPPPQAAPPALTVAGPSTPHSSKLTPSFLSPLASSSFALASPTPPSPSIAIPLPLALPEFFSVLGISAVYLLKICSDEGIDDASFFEEYSLDDLVKIGVKNAHARRIKSALSRHNMRRGSSDNKNEDAPPAYD